MKLYPASKRLVETQLAHILASRAAHDPDFDPDSYVNVQRLHNEVTSEALSMAIGVLVRLDVLNDPRNDEAQASARELVKALSLRLDQNVVDDFGIPL